MAAWFKGPLKERSAILIQCTFCGILWITPHGPPAVHSSVLSLYEWGNKRSGSDQAINNPSHKREGCNLIASNINNLLPEWQTAFLMPAPYYHHIMHTVQGEKEEVWSSCTLPCVLGEEVDFIQCCSTGKGYAQQGVCTSECTWYAWLKERTPVLCSTPNTLAWGCMHRCIDPKGNFCLRTLMLAAVCYWIFCTGPPVDYGEFGENIIACVLILIKVVCKHLQSVVLISVLL